MNTKSYADPSIVDEVNAHINKWNKCTSCPLSGTRKVHYRGSLPCDILYVDEYPNESDIALRMPTMSGQRSKVMNEVLDLVDTWFMCNSTCKIKQTVITAIACNPHEHKVNKSNVAACSERVLELVEFAKPKLIVLMGNYPKLLSPYLITYTCRLTKSLDWMLQQRDSYLEVKKVALLVAPVLHHQLTRSHEGTSHASSDRQ